MSGAVAIRIGLREGRQQGATRGTATLDRIGYGIIGAGWILPDHAIAARHLRDQDVELAALADIDAGRTRHAAEEFGARHWYTDYRELLARDDVQVVSLCLPHHLHRDVAIDAARAGKHVLCEKPLALDAGEADAMIAAARRAAVKLGVIFQHRWDLPFSGGQQHRWWRRHDDADDPLPRRPAVVPGAGGVSLIGGRTPSC